MQTECSQDCLDFASLGSRKVTAAFDGGAITSNAGALLLREADRGIGLSRQVAACFKDGRRQDRIEHAVETLLAQRIYGILATRILTITMICATIRAGACVGKA